MMISRPLLSEREKEKKNISLIVQAVKDKGEAALLEYASLYDSLESSEIRVSDELIQAAKSSAEEAVLTAFENLKAFHELQIPKSYTFEISKV